jgi:hypothetical protein
MDICKERKKQDRPQRKTLQPSWTPKRKKGAASSQRSTQTKSIICSAKQEIGKTRQEAAEEKVEGDIQTAGPWQWWRDFLK